jgi:hypothetical protein
VWGRCVTPCVIQRPEASTFLGDLVQNIEEVTGRAGQTIETGDEEHVVRLKGGECLPELGAIGPGAADLLPEDLLGPGSLELGDLGLKGLSLG